MRGRERAYWVVTGVFCLLFVIGGSGHLVRAETIRQGMAQLGYPAYVMTILGVAKLLGVVAVLVPGRPLLKEWAYAGFSFDLLGATASHLFVGDPIAETARPLAVLALGAASYGLRPLGRRLPASPHASRIGGVSGDA